MQLRRVARSLAVLSFAVAAAAARVAPADTLGDDGTWHAAWSRPQHITTYGPLEVAQGHRGNLPLVEQTLRVVTRLTGEGTAVRVTLSNLFGPTPRHDGTTPLAVAAATVAVRTSGASVDPSTLRALTFGGAASVELTPGGRVRSDAVPLDVHAGQDLAVSLHVTRALVVPTHGQALVTSYVAAPGADHTAEPGEQPFTFTTGSAPIVTSVEVSSDALTGTIAATGGSVTDGTGSDMDGHNDFPGWLARRVLDELPVGAQKTVVNHGIGGTTAASICANPAFGRSVEERLTDETLSLPNVRTVIVYAGTNDLSGGCTGADIIAAYRNIIDTAGGAGANVLISTITPRLSYTPAQNEQREVVNAWVRSGGDCSGECHRALDFDAVLRDPAMPNRIDPALDSGDGIHPNAEGYRRIAYSIPLDAL